jgi:hypothetical protein
MAQDFVLTRSQQVDGSLTFQAWGESEQPMIVAEEDTGPLTHALLQAEAGSNIVGVREWMTMSDFAVLVGRVLGVDTNIVAEAKFLSQMPPPFKEVLNDSIDFFDEFGYAGQKVDKSVRNPWEVSCRSTFNAHLADSKQLGIPLNLGSVEDWIKKSDWSAVLQTK